MGRVKPKAERRVMHAFLTAHGDPDDKSRRRARRTTRLARKAQTQSAPTQSDVICEEDLLEAFVE